MLVLEGGKVEGLGAVGGAVLRLLESHVRMRTRVLGVVGVVLYSAC